MNLSHKTDVKIPEFRGNVEKAQPWIKRLRKLKTLLVDNEQDATKKKQRENALMFSIWNVLKGTALSWWDSNFDDDFPSWDDFDAKFKERFLGPQQTQKLWTMWHEANMAPDDSPEEYHARLADLRSAIGTDINNEIIKRRFIEGLPPKLKADINLECQRSDLTDLNKILDRTTLIWETDKAQIRSVNNVNQPAPQPRCFNCNKFGHIARNCPDKKRNFRQGSRGSSCNFCGCRGHQEADCRIKKRDPNAPRCNYCHKRGHIESDCRIKARNAASRQAKSNDSPAKVTTVVARDEDASPTKVTNVNADDEGPELLTMAPVQINGCYYSALLDGGSQISIITAALADELELADRQPQPRMTLTGAGETHSDATTRITIRAAGYEATHLFHVVNSFPHKLLLGKDWLRRWKVKEDHSSGTYSIMGEPFVPAVPLGEDRTARAVGKARTLKPGHLTAVTIKIDDPGSGTLAHVEPQDDPSFKIHVFEGVYKANAQGYARVFATTTSDTEIRLHKKTAVATAHRLDDKNEPVPLPEGMTEEENAAFERRLEEIQISDDDILNYATEHLQHLTADQRQKTIEALRRHRRVFIKPGEKPVASLAPAYQIRWQGQPRVEKQRHWPPNIEDTLRDETRDLINTGLMELNPLARWRHEWVLVRKKSGAIRPTNDYSRTNIDNVLSDAYPLNDMMKSVEGIGGCDNYGEFDLRDAYHQFWLTPDSREITAVRVPDGLAVWKVAPMGIKSAAAALARGMDIVMKELPPETRSQFKVYCDDIQLGTKGDYDAFLRAAEALWTAMERWRIQLSIDKMRLGLREVDALGFKINKNGIKPSPERVRAITEMRTPATKKEVRSFLGMTVQYRRFVRNFAEIAQPLNELLQKDTKFDWTPRRETAFNTIKKMLTSAPMMRPPDWKLPFTLATDASDVGIGAVLLQQGHPIAYYSKALSKAERKWPPFDKEFFAGFDAMRHFRRYLAGHNFTWWTDHEPLLNYQNSLHLDHTGKRARWAEAMGTLDFNIEHKAGTTMEELADPLSRPPFVTATVHLAAPDTESWLRDQQDDPDIRAWTAYVTDKRTLPGYNENLLRKNTAAMFIDEDGLLRRIEQRDTDEPRSGWIEQLIVPRNRRPEILKLEHDDRGHEGATKMMLSLRERYYWPSMRTDAVNWKETCIECQRYAPLPDNHGPLDSIVAKNPMDLVAYDSIGPLPKSDDGYRYALIGVDYATDFPFALPMKSNDTENALAAMRTVHANFGSPMMITTDGAPNFVSAAAAAYFRDVGSDQYTTRPYNARGNGKVENKVKLLKKILSKLGIDGSWPEKFPAALTAMRNTVLTTKRTTPYFLMFGRDPRTPQHYNSPTRTTELTRHRQLEEVYERATALLAKEKERQKEYFDRHHPAVSFAPGDYVWLKNNKKEKKHDPDRLGPFVIAEKLNDKHYRLGDTEYATLGRRDHIVHVRFLHQFASRRTTANNDTPEVGLNDTFPSEEEHDDLDPLDLTLDWDSDNNDNNDRQEYPSNDSIDDHRGPQGPNLDNNNPAQEREHESAVTRITDHRDSPTGREYLTHWSPTWIPADTVDDLQDEIASIIETQGDRSLVDWNPTWTPEPNFIDEDGTATEAFLSYSSRIQPVDRS